MYVSKQLDKNACGVGVCNLHCGILWT